MTAPAINVDGDVFGQMADVVLSPHRRRASRRNPGDKLLLMWNATLDGIGRRTCFAVTFTNRLAGHQSSEWITMDNIRVPTIGHCPIEFILFVFSFFFEIINVIIKRKSQN